VKIKDIAEHEILLPQRSIGVLRMIGVLVEKILADGAGRLQDQPVL